MSELLMKMPLPYEPKFSNRWLIKFKGNYKKIPLWVLSKTARPSWVLNTGKGSWSDINISFRDPITTSTSKTLMDSFNMSGKKKKIKYVLEMLDATGVLVEKWKISGVIKKIDFGELDYSNDSLVEITLTIKPTKVKLIF